MSYRDALRAAEALGDHTSEETRAKLAIVASHIGERVRACAGGAAGGERAIEEIETLCRALAGIEEP